MAEGGFSVTNCRTLIKIKHDQCWTGSDMIRVSQICYGKWPAEGGFSVTNLGNQDRIRHDQDLADGGFSVTNLGNLDRIRHDHGLADFWITGALRALPCGRRPPMGAEGPQLAKRACPPRRGLEGEPRSGSNF